MLTQLGVVLANTDHGLSHGSRHAGSRAFRRGVSGAIATTESNRTRKFTDEEVAFRFGLSSLFIIADCLRLLDVLRDLGETPSVRLPGLSIEEHVGIKG